MACYRRVCKSPASISLRNYPAQSWSLDISSTRHWTTAPQNELAGSIAHHTPEGVVIVVSPGHDLSYLNDHMEPVDLCSVTAAVLESIYVTIPHYMPEPLHKLVLALQAGGTHTRLRPGKRRKMQRYGTGAAA